MDPETSLPSHLPTMSPPTPTLHHRSGLFPDEEGALALQSQQQLAWASPSHILMSQPTLWPKLGTSLRVLHSPGPPLRPQLQPTTSQNTSYMSPAFQPQKGDQHNPQKDDLTASEASQDTTIHRDVGEPPGKGISRFLPDLWQTSSTKWRSHRPRLDKRPSSSPRH